MSLEGSSVISIEASEEGSANKLQQQQQGTNEGGSAILNLLKQGEKKKELEEKELLNKSLESGRYKKLDENEAEGDDNDDDNDDDDDLLPTGGSKETALRQWEVPQWSFLARGFQNASVQRYSPQELLALKNSPLATAPEELPPKSYYRLNAKVLRTGPGNNNTSYNNNRRGSGYNRHGNRNYDSTGTMGNFNLGRNSGGRGQGRNGRRRGRKYEEEVIPGLDKNAPAISNADDFEKWKAQMSMGIRGEKKEDRTASNVSTPAAHDESKNSVDSFFGLAARSTSSTVGEKSEPHDSKNSRFFSMFANESQPSTPLEEPSQKEPKGDVSKILSFLDRGQTPGEKVSTPKNISPPPGLAHPQQSTGRSQFFATPTGRSPQQQEQPDKNQEFQKQKQPQFPPGLGPQKQQHLVGSPLPQRENIDQQTASDQQQKQSVRGDTATPQDQKPASQAQQKSHSQQQQPSHPQQMSFQQPPPGLQGMPQIPPWMNANIPPNVRQQMLAQAQQQQRFMMPPPGMGIHLPPGIPQGMPPPQFQGGNANFVPQQQMRGNMPPQMMYPPQLNEHGIPMFLPPGMAPPSGHQQGRPQQQESQQQGQQQSQQQSQQQPPPGFYPGPPQGYIPTKR